MPLGTRCLWYFTRGILGSQSTSSPQSEAASPHVLCHALSHLGPETRPKSWLRGWHQDELVVEPPPHLTHLKRRWHVCPSEQIQTRLHKSGAFSITHRYSQCRPPWCRSGYRVSAAWGVLYVLLKLMSTLERRIAPHSAYFSSLTLKAVCRVYFSCSSILH